jgi:hypothetical protein
MPLQNLRVLWLAENPCTKLPHYRAFVVAHLPSLENLDDEAVRWDQVKQHPERHGTAPCWHAYAGLAFYSDVIGPRRLHSSRQSHLTHHPL